METVARGRVCGPTLQLDTVQMDLFSLICPSQPWAPEIVPACAPACLGEVVSPLTPLSAPQNIEAPQREERPPGCISAH